MGKLGLFLILVFSFENAFSQADAKGLFETMGIEKTHKRNVEKLVLLRLEAQPALKPHAAEVRRIFNETMAWNKLSPEAEDLMIRNFTQREIEELKKFYSTQTGKKSLDLMPLLLADVIEIGRQRTEEELKKFIDSRSKTKK